MLFACVCVLSFVHLFAASWTVARQVVRGLFQARIREPMLFLHPVDLPNPGIKPVSSAWQAHSLALRNLGSSYMYRYTHTHTHMYLTSLV